MTSPGPRFTVLIPTRNRADVLSWALKTVTQQEFDSLEILVSDNASDCDVRSVVDDAKDPRVRYIRTPSRMGMTEHWNWAIDQVNGEWLTVVGDDDGLAQGALSRLQDIVVEHPGVQHVTSSAAAYLWPGVTEDGWAQLSVPTVSNQVSVRDLPRLRENVLTGRATWNQLPMIYTGGWVLRRVLESVRGHDGVMLRAMAPDVYSGAALLGVLQSAIKADEVLAIQGRSSHSNGMSHFRGESGRHGSIAHSFVRETSCKPHPELLPTSASDFPLTTHALFLDAWLHASHLYPDQAPDWTIQVNALAESCLTSTLLASSVRSAELGRVARIANRHGVEWNDALARMMRRRRSLRSTLERWRHIWRYLASNYHLRSAPQDMPNVYEASRALSQLREVRSQALRAWRSASAFAASRMRQRRTPRVDSP